MKKLEKSQEMASSLNISVGRALGPTLLVLN